MGPRAVSEAAACQVSASAELPRMSRVDFEQFRVLIRTRCGIEITDAKQTLLRNRIGKRLRALSIGTFQQYYDLVLRDEEQGRELANLWSVVTTHETHFFREAHHFESLEKVVLPRLLARRTSGATLRVWSAGCSTGQEAYTLAAVLLDALPGIRVEVLGTDIDAHSLEVARRGRYSMELRREIPAHYLLRYFRLEQSEIVATDALRKCVRFECLNLHEPERKRRTFDVIFCRNVVMYFHMEFRARLLERFDRSLADDGYLYLGSAESMHGLPRIFQSERVGKGHAYRKADPEGEQS